MDCQRSARGSSMMRSMQLGDAAAGRRGRSRPRRRPAGPGPCGRRPRRCPASGRPRRTRPPAVASSSGTPGAGQLVVGSSGTTPGRRRAAASAAAHQTCSTPLGEELDGLGELQRLRPVAEQPARAALDQPPRVQPDPGLDVGRRPCCRAPRPRPSTAPGRRSRGPRSAPGRSPRARRRSPRRSRCRKVVPPVLTMSLTSTVVMISRRSGWPSMCSGNRSRSAVGKYACSRPRRYGSSGSVGGEQLVRDRDLGVGQQHGQLRAGSGPCPALSRSRICRSVGRNSSARSSQPVALQAGA